MEPEISVIVPLYNQEKYVVKSLSALFSQTYRNFEIIIVDDASTDNSYIIVDDYLKVRKISDSKYNGPSVKLIKNSVNQDISRTTNIAIKASRGKYICINDPDDISEPNRLKIQHDFLVKNNEYAVIGSNLTLINENDITIGYRKYSETYDEILKTIVRESPLANPSVMIKKSVLDEFNGYPNDYFGAVEYELWFKIAQKYKIANINQYLVKYRISSTQVKSARLKITLKDTIKIQKKYLFDKNTIYAKNLELSDLLLFYSKYLLLLLPNSIILYLFKKIYFRKNK